MFCGYFKPKFYKKCKRSIKYIKIRLDVMKRKKNVMINFLKTDIVEILQIGHEHDDIAYIKVEELLEDRSIVSSYDLIEQFCDCISSNLWLMLKQRECPEECREAVSSLIYAAAWVRNFPELKDLRALLTSRYGNCVDSSVNQELVEKLVWRKPSREVRVQTLQEIAQESNIRWDPIYLTLELLKQSSHLQIEQKETSKVETGVDDDPSEDESVLSQRWRRDSLFEGSSSSSTSSSSSSGRRESVKEEKKIFPYGLISPPYTKQGARNDENGQDKNKEKSIVQENSRLPGPQGSASLTSTNNKKAFSTRENKTTSSFQRPKSLDYDEMVARLADFRRK